MLMDMEDYEREKAEKKLLLNACGQQITTRIRRSGSSFTLRWLPGGRSWCMWMRTAM